MTETVGLREKLAGTLDIYRDLYGDDYEIEETLLTVADLRELLAFLPTEGEPDAWMVHYGCGCDIPCTTKVNGTWCPKHDEDGPVVGHTALFATPEESAEVERERDEARLAVRHLRSRVKALAAEVVRLRSTETDG